jgi:hypothetical protein
MITIYTAFDFGQIVYLKTDTQQLPRIVTSVQYGADLGLLYRLCQGEDSSWNYEIEISSEKDILLATTG